MAQAGHKADVQAGGMSLNDAIYGRRAVRDYKPDKIDAETIRRLATAAVQAPTAMHEEPWLFTVIQDREILRELSDSAKRHVKKELVPDSKLARDALGMVNDDKFNIFYNAGTLVVIWAKPKGEFAQADCWLAAENLMLAACAEGLGSCVIGFAAGALNTAYWRGRLGLHEKMMAVAPIIIGVPMSQPAKVPRREPEILTCG